MSFKNKVVLVVGASSGIGAAAAVAFAKQGASVAIIGRNEEKLKDVSKQCEENGKTTLVINADIRNDNEAKRAVTKTIETFGQLDILINNAGIARPGSILAGNIMTSYDELMNTNLRSHVHFTSLSAPHLIKTKGNIINISSVSGTTVKTPSAQIYAVSKAALNHFTRMAAAELASVGVRVNAVSPGPVDTDILVTAGLPPNLIKQTKTALKRISEPEEISDIILFLASDKARGVTGSEYACDNGLALC